MDCQDFEIQCLEGLISGKRYINSVFAQEVKTILTESNLPHSVLHLAGIENLFFDPHNTNFNEHKHIID